MNIAGLDIATTSGLTKRTADGVYTTTTYRGTVKKKKFLDKDEEKKLDLDHEGEIARRWEDFLTCWLIDNQIGYVGIEAPLPSNKTSRKKVIDTQTEWAGKAIRYEEKKGTSMASIYRLYGLSMIAAAVCKRLNIPCILVHQGSWRADFLGNGRPTEAKKEAMKMCRRLGILVTSEDAAESVGVCWWLHNHLNPASRPGDLFGDKPMTHAQLQIKEAAEAVFKPRILSESK